jgi:hypothetical protein
MTLTTRCLVAAMSENRTINKDDVAIVIDEAGDVRVILPEGITSEPPWPSHVFLALGLAALMKEEPRDELTTLFVRKLLKAVREIAAKTAPEVLKRHDLMESIDPERATRN